MSDDMDDVLDCAIVGGGVSGLYAGWRLAACPRGQARRVVLFESSARLGGRLETVEIPGTASRGELGAMRFVRNHRLLDSLLTHLQLPSEPFPNVRLRRLHLRGQGFAGDELQRAGLAYALRPEERGADAYGLLAAAIEALVPGALTGELGPGEWRDIERNRRWRGVLLRDLSCATALRQVVSGEAYRMLLDVIGIESVLSDYNAAAALRLLASLLPAFAAGLARRPSRGWSSLADRLAGDLMGLGGGIERGHRLRSLRCDGVDRPISLEFATAGTTSVVRARRVILAVPARALGQIDMRGVDTTTLRAGLQQVLAEPAFRLLGLYDRPFWPGLGAPDGFAVTDQPIRQVFYSMGLGGSPDDARVLMAAFCDGAAARHWGTLARVDAARPPGTASLLERVVRDGLCELHGAEDLPTPTWTAWRDWSADPYGGGWHAWLAGVDVPTAVARMRRPFAPAPVYVCGEAFSCMQGWVEGALMSAERVVRAIDPTLPAPTWLDPPDHDLGP